MPMFKRRTVSWVSMLCATILAAQGQGSQHFDYVSPFVEAPTAHQWPASSWEEALLPGYEREQLAHMERELAVALKNLQTRVVNLQAMVAELERANARLLRERQAQARQIEQIAAENDLLRAASVGFDPWQEDVVAGTRPRMQEVEQARRKAAQQMQRNQTQLARYWDLLANHEMEIVRYKDLLQTCQLLSAVQP